MDEQILPVPRRRMHCGNGHPWNEENTAWRPSGRRSCRACERLGRKGRLYRRWEENRRALDPQWPEKKQAIMAELAVSVSRETLKERYGVSLQVLRSLEAERLGLLPAPKTLEQRRWEKINRQLQVRAGQQ